jgi:dipeptidyl aminopeptidase/acylaminoacyl peptidase
MRRIVFAATLFATALPTLAAPPLTLDTIMADPDWIGPAVENPYWSADGHHIYYALKRDGSSIRDLYRVDPASGQSIKLDDKALADADGEPVFDRAHRHAAFVRHGDVFVRDLASGKLTQVTRTPAREGGLQWSADGTALHYRNGNDWYAYTLAGGLAAPVATLKTADDPEAKQPDDLGRLQLHLFKTLRDIRADKDARRAHERELDRADATRSGTPFWIGEGKSIVDTALSPDGRWMIVATEPAHHDEGKHPPVNHYVTESGYTEAEDARIYVGRNDPPGELLLLLDLAAHKQYPLSMDALPGIHDDPLKALRAQTQAALRKAGHDDEAKALDAPKTRAVRVSEEAPAPIVFSDDGSLASIELRAVDSKDRWIVSVDRAAHTLAVEDHLHDDAWINWNFNDIGYMPGSHVLWFLSEASGYSQLYTRAPGGKTVQLTSGKFEVSHPQLSADGKWFYVLANKESPIDYDVYRIPTGGGDLQRITHYQGMYGFEAGVPFVLSPDGSKLIVMHSSAYMPAQLAVVNADGSGARELTDTRKPDFKAMHWVEPEIVQVPSTHGAGHVWAKLYKPADYDASVPHPAVFFVHGAGYLQDVTRSWTYYFREQMFANLLLSEGYVVLDMDYRGSEGYGRNWRTAIYRQMGHPELEDLLDGKAWLVENQHVDPKRIGIYGGSYGGYMTLIALLRAPGEFAAGAALRPVTDWTTYDHGYTSDILNDPQIDPEAYAKSSPIEYAQNLADPLLIEHGLIDDNVLTADSIRLYQRFIELHKKNFWMSLYPMERHGFEHADSWYDEYRRIHELFDTYVRPEKN